MPTTSQLYNTIFYLFELLQLQENPKQHIPRIVTLPYYEQLNHLLFIYNNLLHLPLELRVRLVSILSAHYTGRPALLWIVRSFLSNETTCSLEEIKETIDPVVAVEGNHRMTPLFQDNSALDKPLLKIIPMTRDTLNQSVIATNTVAEDFSIESILELEPTEYHRLFSIPLTQLESQLATLELTEQISCTILNSLMDDNCKDKFLLQKFTAMVRILLIPRVGADMRDMPSRHIVQICLRITEQYPSVAVDLILLPILQLPADSFGTAHASLLKKLLASNVCDMILCRLFSSDTCSPMGFEGEKLGIYSHLIQFSSSLVEYYARIIDQIPSAIGVMKQDAKFWNFFLVLIRGIPRRIPSIILDKIHQIMASYKHNAMTKRLLDKSISLLSSD